MDVIRPYQTALLDEHPLIILPTLAKVFGLNEAVVIQQMHYWVRQSKHEIDGRLWVYNSYGEWQKQLPFLSERTIRRTITQLEHIGVILSGNFNRLPIDQTKWYTLNYEQVDLMVRPCVQSGQPMWPKWPVQESKLATPLPETTTETNSETTTLNTLSDSTGQPSHQQSIPYSDILDHLNKKVGTKFKSSTNKTRQLIQARWKEGFTLDDFYTVIDKKAADWLGTQWQDYLRPETLFGTKFESYLNEKVGVKRGGFHQRPSRQIPSTRGTQDGRTFGVVKR